MYSSTRKPHRKPAKQGKSPQGPYLVISSERGILFEGRLRLPRLLPIAGALFLCAFFVLLMLLLDGLLSDPEGQTEEPAWQSAPTHRPEAGQLSEHDPRRLALSLRKMEAQLQRLHEIQRQLHELRFSDTKETPSVDSFLVSLPQEADTGIEAQGGGPDEDFLPSPLRSLLLRQSKNLAALMDVSGFVAGYDFWIRSWPHLWPLRRERQHITSGYGFRKNPTAPYAAMQFHRGLDLRGSVGTPVQAVADGIVHIAKSKTYGYGKRIRIVHDTGYETMYAHLSRIFVKENERVRAGHIIGQVGSTGNSTGPHLHYEVRLNGKALNPARFLEFSSK